MGSDMGDVVRQPHSESASDRRADYAATLTYCIAPKERQKTEKLFSPNQGKEEKKASFTFRLNNP